ncbi:MAG: sugar phosphate isomerase/epimerase [Oscillospiraceae bacterium]|nr:sugar phosphate isomerase/epimerase [Oscillospiraceae bacterium]
MIESIHKYLKVGIVAFMAYPTTMKGEGPVLEMVTKVCADDYFDAIEVTHIADDSVRAKAKAALEQSHIGVYYGAQPRLLTGGLNPNALDENERQKAVDILLNSIDEAEYLGAKGIAFLAGKFIPEKQGEHFDVLLETTRTLCNYAAKKNMSIVLEVFDYDLDKKSLIGPAPIALAFAQEMRKTHNNFGLMVDLSHIPQTYETSRFVLQTLRPYIVHFHIGNAVIKPGAEAFGDTHPRFGFPNSPNDTAEVLEFLRWMKAEGFLDEKNPPVLSFEVKPWGDEEPELVIAGAKRVLNRAWALLDE